MTTMTLDKALEIIQKHQDFANFLESYVALAAENPEAAKKIAIETAEGSIRTEQDLLRLGKFSPESQ